MVTFRLDPTVDSTLIGRLNQIRKGERSAQYRMAFESYFLRSERSMPTTTMVAAAPSIKVDLVKEERNLDIDKSIDDILDF